MRDFDVTVKLRNNHLVERRERLGLSAPQLAEAVGISYKQYNDYEHLRRSPMNHFRPGEVKASAQRLCDFFGVLPDELWPEQVLRVRCSVLRRKLDYGQMVLMASDDMRARHLLPDAAVEELEAAQAVQRAVASIPNAKNRQVIVERFGLDRRGERTLDEIADQEELTRGGVQHREWKGMRHLRSTRGAGNLDDLAAEQFDRASGEGKTRREVARELGVQTERIRHCEQRAIEDLRDGPRSYVLRAFAPISKD